MKVLTGEQIRKNYLEFFTARGHTAVPSSSLVPGGDSTLLFTNSGMVQFKDVFLGTDKRPYARAVDSQKCMRVAGKHNDLDDVGRDDSHHTFFEMLGNWSFGDYYKKEAIAWAWELLTDVWGLPRERLYATVFQDDQGDIPGDTEASENWLRQPGFVQDHLYHMGRKDNFWEMADTGPCGPCSEIHYDLTPGAGPVDKDVLESDRFVELWNLVFIQYNRLSPDTLEPLPAKHVDTGMGFERLVSILQGADSNYKTDLFARSLAGLRGLTGQSEAQMLADFTPYRVICDHARAAAFLIADGVVPGNTGRNYICRMIIRRAARFGAKLGLDEPFLAGIAGAVIETYGSFYPELVRAAPAIADNLTREERRFARTVESGTAQLQNHLDALRKEAAAHARPPASAMPMLDGARAFDLYATYGLPLEIARDIAREQGLEVDEAGFHSAMEAHRLASGGGKQMGRLGGEDADFFSGILRDLRASGKLGEAGVEYDPYTSLISEGEVLALLVNGRSVQTASFGDQVEVILPRTCFYAEAGGQVDDTGYIRARGSTPWEIEVVGVRRPSAGVIVHVGEVVSGEPRVGERCVAEVDAQRRRDIMRNHTATHLLHSALHQVLGEHARQAGSLVAPDRLRFDFNHPEGLSADQLERVERLVNEAVAADMLVVPKLKSREDAIAEGAMALFGEKYGETVRTITISPTLPSVSADTVLAGPTALVEQLPKYSYELCGGTHLERTSDVGAFLIVSEGSTAAGVRRIEAVTGRGAYELISQRFRILDHAARLLKTYAEEVPSRIQALQDELAAQAREVGTLRSASALASFGGHLEQVSQVDGVSLLVAEIPDADGETLRKLADRFRERYPTSGLAVLYAGKQILAVLTEDLTKRGLRAADLIAAAGGKGGGRANLAQGSLNENGSAEALAAAVSTSLRTKLKKS